MQLNENIASIIGLLQTDGCLENNKTSFFIQNNQKELIDIVKKWVKKEFNYEIHIKKVNTKWKNINKPCSYTLMAIYSKNVFNYLDSLLIDGKNRVPNAIFVSNETIIYSYLASVFDGDGTIYNYKSNGYIPFRTTIRLKKKNLGFIQDIQKLLLKIGIQSRIYKHKQPSNDNFIKRKGNNSFAWALEIIRKSELIKFYEKINFRVINKKEKIEAFYKNLNFKN